MSLILAAVTAAAVLAASLALLRYMRRPAPVVTSPHIIMNNNTTMDQGVRTRGKAQRQLILASRDGDLALVEVLVGQGVNPNATLRYRDTGPA